MSFFGSSSTPAGAEPGSTELKNALMKQVQTEAAMTNARALVSVRLFFSPFISKKVDS
jgi:import inner membrane translocase subunit TIM13